MKKLISYIKNTYICIKYPFLYPRNRFTGEHYTNWYLTDKINKLNLISRDDVLIEKTSKVELEKGERGYMRNSLLINGHSYTVRVKEDKDDVGIRSIVISDKRGEVCYRLCSSDILDEGQLLGYKCTRDKLSLYISDKYKYKDSFFGYKRVTLYTDTFITYIIKGIKIIHSICSLFHCIPSYNELDMMPKGWKISFGYKMCDEIKEALLKKGGMKALYEYRIFDIKEKFGTLRWYDSKSSSDIQSIISKYEKISGNTCIRCGKEAKWISRGWISPYCDECIRICFTERGDPNDWADYISE